MKPRWWMAAGVCVPALVGLWMYVGRKAPAGVPSPSQSEESVRWRKRSPSSSSGGGGGAPAPAAVAIPRIDLSAASPPFNPSDDDHSPVLARLQALAQPSPVQEKQIRALWKAHEDERRKVLAQHSPSAASAEVYFHDRLIEIDSEMEMALVSSVLEPDQRDRVLAAIGHTYPPR